MRNMWFDERAGGAGGELRVQSHNHVSGKIYRLWVFASIAHALGRRTSSVILSHSPCEPARRQSLLERPDGPTALHQTAITTTRSYDPKAPERERQEESAQGQPSRHRGTMRMAQQQPRGRRLPERRAHPASACPGSSSTPPQSPCALCRPRPRKGPA